MKQGTLELRSGLWSWLLEEPGEIEGRGTGALRLRAVNGDREEMEAVVPSRPMGEELDLRGLAAHASVRRFTAGDGTLWTAELRRPPSMPGRARNPASMVLFWCEDRACLTTLKPSRGLGEMTVDELRAHLSLCLNS